MRVSVLTDAGQVHLDVAEGVAAAEIADEVSRRSGGSTPARLHRVTGEALDPDQGLTAQTAPGALLVLRPADGTGLDIDPDVPAPWVTTVRDIPTRPALALLVGSVGAIALLAATLDESLPRQPVALGLLLAGLALSGVELVRPPAAGSWVTAHLAVVVAACGAAAFTTSRPVWGAAVAGILTCGLLALGGRASGELLPVLTVAVAVGIAELCRAWVTAAESAGIGLVLCLAGVLMIGRRPLGIEAVSPRSVRQPVGLWRRNSLVILAVGVLSAVCAAVLLDQVAWALLPVLLAAAVWWSLGWGIEVPSQRWLWRTPGGSLAALSVLIAPIRWPETRAVLGLSLLVVSLTLALLPRRRDSAAPVGLLGPGWPARLAALLVAPATAVALSQSSGALSEVPFRW